MKPGRREMPEAGSFDEKKRVFFMKLGVEGLKWFKAHDTLGHLWDGTDKEKRWENVSEHCLVEAARANVLSDWLQLSAQTKEQLFGAAILHDFNKKEEIEYTTQQGSTPESFDEVYARSRAKLVEAGFDPAVIEIADSVGHASCQEMEAILTKSEILEQDIARLVLHYLDDYTINAEWAGAFDGAKNDLDRRMDMNDINPKYAAIAQAGFYAEQRRIGSLVEQKLAELLSVRSLEPVDAKLLPELVDQRLKNQIEAVR